MAEKTRKTISFSPPNGSFAPGCEPKISNLEYLISGRKAEFFDSPDQSVFQGLLSRKVGILEPSFQQELFCKASTVAENSLNPLFVKKSAF